MGRLHLFEFNDQGWLPRFMTSWMTRILRAAHQKMQNGSVWAPKVLELTRQSGQRRIVDLCSGGGGPVLDLVDSLEGKYQVPIHLVLTDIIPNLRTATEINGSRPDRHYMTEPINAVDVPSDLQGIRTVFSGFHHMKKETAKKLLRQAFARKEYIFISETTFRSPLAMLVYGLAPIHFFYLTCQIKPTLWQVLFTFFIPILPLMLGWDNVVSCLRTYSFDELQELIAGLRSDDYCWEIGTLQHPKLPTPYPYIMGYPRHTP